VSLLSEHDYIFDVMPVIALQLQNRPGELAAVTRKFGEEGININYVYGSVSGPTPLPLRLLPRGHRAGRKNLQMSAARGADVRTPARSPVPLSATARPSTRRAAVGVLDLLPVGRAVGRKRHGGDELQRGAVF